VSATAIAADAASADALATAFYAGGPAVAEAVCAARPDTLALLALEHEPGVLRVCGRHGGVGIDPAPGFRLAEAGEGGP
jgi:hypothetical protein